ncbi:MAG: O-antigen ligase family protein [Planctomycetota bacterium]
MVVAMAALLTAMALIPCFTPSSPVRYFDSDPRMQMQGQFVDQLPELGPLGVAWLQALTVAVAGLGMIVAVWAGAKLSRVALVLSSIGMAAAVVHMTKGTARWEDWTQGGAWIAASAAGVSAMPLAQHEAARRWMVALVAAAAVPLFAEAGWYVWVEHAMTVAVFDEDPQAMLAQHGLAPGTEQAVLFERRMRFADATGTFGLSNVLASVAGGIAMLGFGVAGWLVWRLRNNGRWVVAGAAGGAALAAFAVVALTASKGAVLALVATCGLGVLVFFGTRWPRLSGLIRLAAIAVVVIAFASIWVRGAMGPPPPSPDGFVAGAEIDGERSLLFRWHYLQAAMQITADNPLLGSGARGFADAYLSAKNPINPETVTSAHSVFVDQITMLGLGGWAWTALMLWWLWRAGGAVRRPVEPIEAEPTSEPYAATRSTVWTAVGAAAVIFTVTLAVRQGSLFIDTALLWLVAIGLFIAVAALLGARNGVSTSAQRVALLLAATAVLVHNQIEMAFFQPPAMGILWLILGAAGAEVLKPRAVTAVDEPAAEDSAESAKPRIHLGPMVAGGWGLVVLIVMGAYTSGVVRHEGAMAEATTALRRGNLPTTLDRLAEAQHVAGLDTRALRWSAQLVPSSRLSETIEWFEDAVDAEARPATIERLRAAVLAELANRQRTPEAYGLVDKAFASLAEKSPYNIQDRLMWADSRWAAGQHDEAREHYRVVLELREQKYLDPADPLSTEQLERVRRALQSPGQ